MPINIISSEKKQECIDYALAHPEIPTKQLAADLGVGHSTLLRWLRHARNQGVQGASRTLTAEQQRIKDLEKENAHLREVNEIIKKAHVYICTYIYIHVCMSKWVFGCEGICVSVLLSVFRAQTRMGIGSQLQTRAVCTTDKRLYGDG